QDQAVEIALLLVLLQMGGDGFEEFGFAMRYRVGAGCHGTARGTATAGFVADNVLRLQWIDGPIEAVNLFESFARTGIFEDARLRAIGDQYPGDDLPHDMLLLVVVIRAQLSA